MGKDVSPSLDTAGGGSAHSTPADLSSPVFKTAIEKISRAISGSDFASLQSDPSAPACPSADALTRYLADPTHSVIALPREKDWSYPLNAYFISSSHNTYLTGHQLYGSSTVDGYINVLSRGCRCIEIDVWDGDDGEPEVFHGYTLTKEIKFKKVCKAIRDHAFSDPADERFGGAGEGPVIISLECHASHDQQLKMVKIMEEVWGDMLVKDIEPEDVHELPKLSELRRKIIVKVGAHSRLRLIPP